MLNNKTILVTGETYTPETIRSIRPSNGLHPKYYEEILGKTANCDLKFGTPLKIECINKEKKYE